MPAILARTTGGLELDTASDRGPGGAADAAADAAAVITKLLRVATIRRVLRGSARAVVPPVSR
jgi:hypothetical protein